MTEKIFIDTDVILDIVLKRYVFGKLGVRILNAIENKLFEGYTSSTIITNIYYVQRKLESHNKAIIFLLSLIPIFLLNSNSVTFTVIYILFKSKKKDA